MSEDLYNLFVLMIFALLAISLHSWILILVSILFFKYESGDE